MSDEYIENSYDKIAIDNKVANNDYVKSPFAFRTIGEAAKELNVEPHVLRFWESKFKEITPIKRRGRRYYSSHDLTILNEIKELLYNKGYTIKGVKKYLIDTKEKQEDLFINNKIIEPTTNNNLNSSTTTQISKSEVELVITKLENIYKKLTS